MDFIEHESGFHILAKPIGPLCNLDCAYCFYTEKAQLYPENNNFRMSGAVLETFIKNYIQAQHIPEIQFVWQGGEPTLLGIRFFEEVLDYQRKYAGEKRIINTLQTNGTLIDEAWCVFLKGNNFLVGISIDGPASINDYYRKGLDGNPTAYKVINTIKLFNQYEIQYNALVCVTRESAKCGTEIYNFLKDHDVKYIQFTPIVERIADHQVTQIKLKHASPTSRTLRNQTDRVTAFSVLQGDYSDFLIEIFDIWVREDVGTTFIMNFEWALESWLGLPATVCIFSKRCGKAIAIEHNGDLYACDHYVYPEYHLGNIAKDDLKQLLNTPRQIEFGTAKEASLPKLCHSCDVKFACNGECPRHRFDMTTDGELGLSYLCKDYKKYFRHIHPYMKVMVQLIEHNLPVHKIMDVIQGPMMIVKR